MRYYSQKLGRIVDDGQGTGVSAPATSMDSGGMSSLTSSSTGTAVSPQNKLFALLALSKKDYQGAYDLLNPKEDPEVAKQRQEKEKLQSSGGTAQQFIDTLEKRYQGAGGAETNIPILSNILGAGKTIQGMLNMNDDAKLYNREKKGFATALRKIVGDSGAPSNFDVQRLQDLLPGLGDTGGTATGGFNDIRAQIAAAFDTPQTQTSIKPANKNILEALLPQATSIAQDVGTGIRGRMEQGNLDRQGQLAKMIEDRAYATNDMEYRKQLLREANNLRTGISNEAGDISKSFSKNVNQNPLVRAGVGATEIASAAEAPALVKGAINAPRNITNYLKGGVFTEGTGKTMRTTAVNMSKKSVDGDRIAGDMLDWGATAVKANPGDTKSINKVVGEVIDSYSGKKFSAKELKSIWDKVDSGYTAQGVTKSATKAQADLALRNSLRKMLEEVAPGWEQGTKLIAKGIKNKKLLKGVGKIAGYGAIGSGAAAGSGLIIGSMMGRNQGY